jgi:flagellar basal body-associated protein FliL
MALKKTLIMAGIVVGAIAAGAGGTFAVMTMLMPQHSPASDAAAAAAKAKAAPPKQIYFAELTDVVVSIPADTGQPPSSFVQFGVQFATYDQNAVTTFAELQPIIKADIINLMLNETAKSLQDQGTRSDLAKSCLDISNTVLSRNASYTPANPFTAAYITNLVVQD